MMGNKILQLANATIFILLAATAQASPLTQENHVASKVKVTIDYETLCPDSMLFVMHQLGPVYEKIGSIMDVDLVPYGKASYQSNGHSWSFQCQHGPNECFGNKIHACVINSNPIDAAIKFVQCSMSKNDPVSGSEDCAKDMSLDWNAISHCANGDEGSELLHKYGVRTETLKPKLTYVPWVIFNDKFDQSRFERSLEHLLEVVCEVYKVLKRI
ncbi:hypothetical protein CHUAL_006461 [Chamberlinius hualienensis]